MPNKIEACIFDLDGVIVNTVVYHFKAWQNLAQGLGIEITEEHHEKLKAISRDHSLEIILESGSLFVDEGRKGELLAKKNTEYLSMVNEMNNDALLPGVEEFLHNLKTRKIKIALGSSSRNARLILDKTGILNLFDAIVDGCDVQNAKPDPEIFRLAANLLKVLPENCVVFEDAIAGVAAAKTAGMYCVGIGKPEILTQADQVFPSFEAFSLDDLKVSFNN